MPRFSSIRRALPPSGPQDGAHRCSLEGSVSGPPPSGLTAGELTLFVSCAMVLSILSSCYCWRSATSWGLALFCHRSASRIFIMQPSCGLLPVVIYKDDHQPRGGEKRARLRSPPCPQLQGCSSSSLGWKASRVGVLPSAWAGDPLLPPAFGGEGCSPALRRRRTSATRGRPAAGAVSCRVSGSLAWMALVSPPTLPPAVKWGMAIRPPHGRRSHRAQVRRIRSVPCAASHAVPMPPGGLYKTLYAVEVAATFLDGLVLTPTGGQGQGPLRCGACAVVVVVAGKPLARRWPLPLVRLPGAEVVASTGETTGVTCHRASSSLALMASLSPPVGGQGRGPLRDGAHIEAAITAGELLGAEGGCCCW
jgi:hypothetical protein